jgi:hypothetical protein
MTVTSFEFIHSGWTGKKADGQTIEDFTVHAIAKTDDRDDGPQAIIDYAGTPDVGDSYAVGNDSDTAAKLKEIKPQQISGMVWSVVLVYGNPSTGGGEDSDQSGLDADGNPTNDPSDDAETVDVFSIKYSRPALRGTYIGASYEPDANGKFVAMKGKSIAIQNSSFCKFDPPPEIDDARFGLRVRRKAATWQNFLTYRNAVNNDGFAIFRPWGFNLFIDPFTAKMESMTASYRLRNNIGRWWHEFELHIDPKTWRQEFLDIGFHQRQLEGDIDVLTNTAIPVGQPKKTLKAVIRDDRGTPIVEPHKLNGEGALLTEAVQGTLGGADGVYLKYALYPELPFGLINL